MLKHPLTLTAVLSEFSALNLSRDDLSIWRNEAESEAAVSGSWPLSKLCKLFTENGYKKIPEKEGLRFVNESQTVGIVCRGETPDLRSNRWKTYSFELQARTLGQAKKGSSVSKSLISL